MSKKMFLRSLPKFLLCYRRKVMDKRKILSKPVAHILFPWMHISFRSDVVTQQSNTLVFSPISHYFLGTSLITRYYLPTSFTSSFTTQRSRLLVGDISRSHLIHKFKDT